MTRKKGKEKEKGKGNRVSQVVVKMLIGKSSRGQVSVNIGEKISESCCPFYTLQIYQAFGIEEEKKKLIENLNM